MLLGTKFPRAPKIEFQNAFAATKVSDDFPSISYYGFDEIEFARVEFDKIGFERIRWDKIR